MRIKKTYIVLSFRTTLDAMEWEKQCLAEKVPGRLIPLPVSYTHLTLPTNREV